MRIFFEIKKNTCEDVYSVRKHEIFREYIKHLNDECLPKLDTLLDIITGCMLERYNFDGVKKQDLYPRLSSCGLSIDRFEKLIDGNALIGKKVICNEGNIGEKYEEYIYFVFDELRDYCLAHMIVRKNTLDNTVDVEGIISDFTELRQKKLLVCSPSRGQ